MVDVQTATIVYTFLQSHYHNYFRAFLKPRKSFYNTMHSRMEGEVLEVLQFFFHLFINQSSNLGFSFAYNAPKVWNDLLDDICSATSLLSSLKKLKSYFFTKAYAQVLSYFPIVSVVWTPPLLCLWTSNYLVMFLGCCTLEAVF